MRAKATEEMLRNLPSKRIDWSTSAFENRASSCSLLAEKLDANVGEKVDNSTKSVDAYLETAAGRSGSHRFQGIILCWLELNLSSCFSYLYALSYRLPSCLVLF